MVHEAGHAAFAIRRGVPFVDVRVYPPSQVNEQFRVDGQAQAGGLRLVDENPTEWMPKCPEDALDVLLAGALAERFYLDCFLDCSYEGDMDLWKRGMRSDAAELGSLFIASSSARVWTEMSRCGAAIQSIVLAFQDQLKAQIDGGSNFDEPLVLTSNDVMSLMNA